MFYIQPAYSSTQVASESHQSSWKKADGHGERERCHEAIPQGRSHRQLLDEIFEEGNLLQGSTVSHPKGARFKQKDICLGLYPCSLQFFDIRFHLFLPAFLNRTAVSVHLSFSKVLKLAMDWMKTTTGMKPQKIRKITK